MEIPGIPNQYIQVLTTNATRLGTRIHESLSEQAREFAAAATSSSSSSSYLDNASMGIPGGAEDRAKVVAGIKKQLESNSEREKLDALKRLVALTNKSHPPSSLTLTFFPSVVKLVASPSLEVRKLVYIYLLHHSPYDPDLTLLSINTFQKDLSSDPNPVIRAMALRVLSGMRVPMLANVVVMGIKKCASDTSPYVRKVAALAIPKCYELDPSHLPALLPILTQTLLSSSAFSPLCIGATIYAFNVICPGASVQHLSLIHPHYRKLCRTLVDVDEWGQVELMKLLLRYARVMLSQPGEGGGGEKEEPLDPDLKLLLDSVEPTFQSRNPAVVVAATKIFYYLAPSRMYGKFVGPVMRLLLKGHGSASGVERVVLRYVVQLTSGEGSVAHLFAPYCSRFFVRLSSDSRQIKKDKIRIMLNLLTPSKGSTSDYVHDIWPVILREFVDYAEDVDDEVVSEAVNAIGVLAKRVGGPSDGEVMKMCLKALMGMIKSPYDIVVSSAVQVLKELVHVQLQQSRGAQFSSGTSPLSIVEHLAQRFDDIRHGEARACVVWLVGQYAGSSSSGSSIASFAPDVLRRGAKTFGSEEAIVKLQLVTLAGKLAVLAKGESYEVRLGLLVKYVLDGLARYDANCDVRDRARMIWALVRGLVEEYERPEEGGVVLRREQVKVVLFEGKAVGGERVQAGGGVPALGTLGEVDEEDVPEWMEKGVEGKLREAEDEGLKSQVTPTAFGSQNVAVMGSRSGMGGAGGIGARGMGGTGKVVLVPTNFSGAESSSAASSEEPKKKWKDLEAFLESSSEEEEEESEEESEEEAEAGKEESEEEEESSDEGSSSSEDRQI